MTKKKIPVFYICLLIIIVCVVVLTIIAKHFLNGVLAEYENSQYKHIAEDFFESNFNSGNVETYTKLFATQIPRFETEGSFKEYLSKITNGKKFSLQHTSSGNLQEEKYNILLNNDKFASFAVEKSGEKSKHGFDLYRPSNVVFNENLLNTYYFEVPKDYSLTVNGNIVNDEYITESFEINISDDERLTFNAYAIPSLCDAPVCEIKDPNGELCEVIVSDIGVYCLQSFQVADNKEQNSDNIETPDDNEYIGPKKEFTDEEARIRGEALATEYTDYIIDATEAYACYMQDDASLTDVAAYMDKSSQLYTNIKNSQHQWTVIDHFKYWFEDASVTDFYAYSDDLFSCRITITQVLRYSQTSGNTSADIIKDRKDYIDITWYLHKVNGKYLIYDCYTN